MGVGRAAAANRSEAMQRNGGRQRKHMGARLFAVYAVASLVPVSLLGVVLMRGYHDGGVRHAMDQGRAQAAVIEQMAIAPALNGADLERGLSRAERERLRNATDLAIFHGSVVRLRLLSFRGTVAFSDDGSVLGAVPRGDPAFRAAARGVVDTRLVPAGSEFAVPTIRVMHPVVAESNGRAIGVLEVHLPYEEIAAKADADTRAAILRLALGLLVLYAVLAFISWWTTRALGRHAAEKEHQALHDPLTGLPNRELFRRAAESALSRAGAGEHGALVLVDLDHFKEVNDTLGHHAGDELLRVVARRLVESLRTDDTVARLGGDEFGIILPDPGGQCDLVEMLQRARHEVGREVTLDGATFSVEASFGICLYPEHADTVEDLLQRADAAMYRGKHGTAGVVVYDPEWCTPVIDAPIMQGELRRALEHDEFVLHYQPKIDLRDGSVACLEALLRWQHPERGLLPPGDFLPVAERCEVIEPLTRWVLRRALADRAAWADQGHDWSVAVNVSARNLSSTAIVAEIEEMLVAAGVRADHLVLEITETALAFDDRMAGHVVRALAARGIAMSLDDFGVGFTGIAQLRGLDLAEIKIDRLFIGSLADNTEDQAIVGSLIALAHSLGCTVTAEGVESEDVADWLAAAGCDNGQGYYWLRPAPWTDIVGTTARQVAGRTTEAGAQV
jgi:diguanylate cyclase